MPKLISQRGDDWGLVQRLLTGDQAAFREFFDDNFPRVFRFVSRRVGRDVEMARDVTQGALCKAVRKLDTYRGEASLFTWLCQIARHELSDHLQRERAQSRLTAAIEDDPSVRATLESMQWDESDGDSREAVHAALDYLPSRYARLLEMKYIHDLSVQHIAEQVGTSPVAVQSLLARARRAFREAYSTLSLGAVDERRAFPGEVGP